MNRNFYERDVFFKNIDKVNDIEKLKEIEKKLIDADIMKAYWENYSVAVHGETDLLKRKARVKCRYIAMQYGASVPFSKDINQFRTPHGLRGILISSYAKIGIGCTFFQQVTIGSNTLPGSKTGGFPEIGNNVYIGAGAKIIGNIKIGNNVRIGANCIVTEDISDNSIVVLNKPVVITKDYELDNKFIPAKKYKNEYLE